MDEYSVQRSDVEDEFEKIVNWAVGPVSMTLRFAIFLNTLEILNKLSSESDGAQFFFQFNGQLKTNYFEIYEGEEHLEQCSLATQAGFFLPVFQNTGYSPFKNLEKFLRRNRKAFPDDSFILPAFNQVAHDVIHMAISSKDRNSFLVAVEKTANHYSKNALYLGVGKTEITDIQSEFEVLSNIDVDENRAVQSLVCAEDTLRWLTANTLFEPNLFLNSTSQQTIFDNPSEETISEKREKHKAWVQRFSSSNVSYMYKQEETDEFGFPVEKWQNFNPQTFIP